MENIKLALSLLLAGFIIVFLVLVLLIVIITVYGKLIQAAQKSSQNRKERKKKVVVAENFTPTAGTATVFSTTEDEIPGEIIAAIAAAVDAVYGDKAHTIRSVRRSRTTRSAWGNSGVLQNTGPF